ncbi:N-acetyl-gamma-glutamyl-phosphate reductase [Sphingomonas sp. ID0503]|uniref:N-acetyl-gamma-glutamyl-phosphate reductase n=1 Tax=Sphingomonas sp. ID0503 TaxID=3399691 RepID=UPI003AFB53F5
MKVFIDGAAGTTGLEIRDRLTGRTDISLITIPDDRRKDEGARAEALNAADIVILCLPDDAARQAVALITNPDTRIVDASTAHRTAPDWTYGFPELVGHAAVAASKRISNPGCYSTGFIALVAPLVKAGLIHTDWPLTCNAVSGYSGGGKAMIAEYESADSAPSAWRTYALGLAHKHVPEMQAHSRLAHPPLFTPAVANLHRGMIVEVPLPASAISGSAKQLRQALGDHYAGSRVVRVVADYDQAGLPVEHLAGSDRLDLFVFANEATGQVNLVAALDNLGKGAGGAAVQNLNILAGLDEATGLRL